MLRDDMARGPRSALMGDGRAAHARLRLGLEVCQQLETTVNREMRKRPDNGETTIERLQIDVIDQIDNINLRTHDTQMIVDSVMSHDDDLTLFCFHV